MPSNTNVPVSLPIILDRIDHWTRESEKATCCQYATHCEAIIAELELLKYLIKGQS